MECRFCNRHIPHPFLSLGTSPLSNAYLSADQLQKPEQFYPLEVYVCNQCLLVQLESFVAPEHIFGDYAYFSSYSETWLDHARRYVDMIIARLGLKDSSLVIEVASNDGYLLKNFVEKKIRVLGIEPAVNVAEVARAKGIRTETVFFGAETAERLRSEGLIPDLLLGNNVLAHVPDINDFVAGLKILLGKNGIITMEFPHLLRLMEGNQFDTIYHEHFSYFSFLSVNRIFSEHGLTIFDVEQLPTHGGSLRIYASHSEDDEMHITGSVRELERMEYASGYADLKKYIAFGETVRAAKRDILKFLVEAKNEGKKIAGYGAPAKGNTLLNYCGIGTDFIDYTVDLNPYKQGRFLPGSRIPIKSPEIIKETRPDYLFVLPWNIRDEIMNQMSFIRQWGGKFVVPIPRVEVY